MDMISLYYYTSVPLFTCNMLFYSITSLSNSISSSQNVVKFISEHKDSDSITFTNVITDTDLENKLKIIESLIYDIVKKYCVNNEEFECAKKNILQNDIVDFNYVENNEFALIEIKSPLKVLERIDDPVKSSLIGTADTINNINSLLVAIRDKMHKYNNSYIKQVVSLCLQNELKQLHRLIKILDNRLYLLFEIIKIYIPFRVK